MIAKTFPERGFVASMAGAAFIQLGLQILDPKPPDTLAFAPAEAVAVLTTSYAVAIQQGPKVAWRVKSE